MRHTTTAIGLAATLLLSFTAVASATPAVVTNDLNLRAGQGTNHSVIDVLPQGSMVDVTGCGDGWCYVRDRGGYASASYLDVGSSAYAAIVPPPPVVYGPAYHPGISFSFGFGRPYHRHWRHW